MNYYLVALASHALVAVLGVGQVMALLVLANDAQKGNERLPWTLSAMSRLARIVGISLGLMLLTGIFAMIPTGGAYGRAWWFRIAFLLFILLGACNGMLQRALRTNAVERLPMLTRLMVGIAAIIVILMAAKPF
jgi:hypothetical protein